MNEIIKNISRDRITQVIIKVIALIFGLAPPGTPLAQAAPAPGSASICAMKQHELLVAYYFYASKPKEPAFISTLTQDLRAARDCIKNTATGLALLGLDKSGKELSDQFGKFSASLAKNTDSMARQGHVGSEPLTEMVGQNQDLVTLLVRANRDLQTAAKTKSPAEAEQARNLALTIRYANVLNVERATYALGVTLHRQSNGEPTSDLLLERFATGIEALGTNQKLSPDLKKKVANANTKFRFIHKSMLMNYDKKALSFSVNFYIDSIVGSLLDVAHTLDKKAK